MSFEEMQDFYELEKVESLSKYGKTEKVIYRNAYGQRTSRDGDPYIRKTLYEVNNDIIDLFKKIGDDCPAHFARIEDVALGDVMNQAGSVVPGTVMICEYMKDYESLEAKYKVLDKEGNKAKFYCQQLSGSQLHRLELEVADVAIVICEGLNYLHAKKYLHLDIKPENILVHASRRDRELLNYSKAEAESYPLKIIDYGNVWNFTGNAAVDKNHNSTRKSMMSKGFSAPELIPDEFDFGVPGIYSDVYSVGALMKALLPDDYLTRDSFISPRLQSVIEKAMELDPEDRYQNMGEMLQAIELAKSSYLTRLYNSFKAKIFGAVGAFILWTLLVISACVSYYEMNEIPELQKQLSEYQQNMATQNNVSELLSRKNREYEDLEEKYNKIKNVVHGDDINIDIRDLNGNNTWQYKVVKNEAADLEQNLRLAIYTDYPKALNNSTLTVEYIGLGLKAKKSDAKVQRDNGNIDDISLCHKITYRNGLEQKRIDVDVLASVECFELESDKPAIKITLEAENLKRTVVKTIPIKIVE